MTFSIQEIIILISIGCISGVLGGLFGIGGGVINGPVILFILKGWNISDTVILPLTFGTSLFIIVFTSLSAVIKYQSMKSILWRSVFIMSLFGIIGAYFGATVTVYSPKWILQKIYGLFLIFVAYRISKEFASNETIERKEKLIYLMISGIIIGFVSSMFGVGGGVVGIPIMILFLKYPIKNIASTSMGIILFTSISGVIRYIFLGLKNINIPSNSIGFVNLKIALPLMIGGMLCAPIGAYINNKANVRNLKKIFSLFLAIIGITLIFM